MSRFFWKHQGDPTPRPEHLARDGEPQRPRGVEMLYERGAKTFIAAAVGGPAHGALLRRAVGREKAFTPVPGGDPAFYRLHLQPDGVRIWLHTTENLA